MRSLTTLLVSIGLAMTPVAGMSLARQTVTVKADDLRLPYKGVTGQIEDFHRQIVIAGSLTIAGAGAWTLILGVRNLSAVGPMAMVLAGTSFMASAVLQSRRLKSETRLGALCDQSGITHSHEKNTMIQAILAGDRPEVKVSSDGLTISGVPAGEGAAFPSRQAVQEITEYPQVVLPDVVLQLDTAIQSGGIYRTWMDRMLLPLSILNLILISQDAKDGNVKSAGDKASATLIVLSAITNIYRFITNNPLHEEVAEFKNRFEQGVSLHDLVKSDALDGPMGFLTIWAKELDEIHIRIDRWGNVNLYRDGSGVDWIPGSGPMARQGFKNLVR